MKKRSANAGGSLKICEKRSSRGTSATQTTKKPRKKKPKNEREPGTNSSSGAVRSNASAIMGKNCNGALSLSSQQLPPKPLNLSQYSLLGSGKNRSILERDPCEERPLS